MTYAKAGIALIAPFLSLSLPTAYANPLTVPDQSFVLKPVAVSPEARAADAFRAIPVLELSQAAPQRPRVITTAMQDRSSWLIAARAPTVTARALDWGARALTLRLLRTKSLRQAHETKALTHNRFALWSADLSLDHDLGLRDTVSLAGSFDLLRRRSAFFLGRRNIFRTQTRAASVQWTHDRNWRLSLGVFDRRAGSARSSAERIVELSGGAPLTGRGAMVSASFSPSGDPETFSMGMDLRRERYSVRDASLLGLGTVRAESRAALFVRRAF